MISFIIQNLFSKLKFSPIGVSKKKKNDKESMICLTSKPSQCFFESKENLLQKKNFLKKMGSGGLNKKTKRRLFNCSRYGPYNVNKEAR